MSGERDLCYSDRFTDRIRGVITEDTLGDSIDNETILPLDKRQFLVLEVNGEEWTKIFSSLWQGAALIYPDEAHQITWLYWKSAKMGSFCDAVNLCVAGGGQGAPGGGNPTAPVPRLTDGSDLLPDGWTCDKDHAFAMALAVVDAIHAATTEVFEKIETTSNPSELVAEVGDNIPIASLASSTLDVINWIQETIYEEYISSWSAVIRDEIACQLMCAMVEDCALSYTDIMRVYTSVGGAPHPGNDAGFIDWINWLVAVVLSTDEIIVKSGGLLGLVAMLFGSKFGSVFNVGVYGLETVMALAANSTEPNWEILCVDCPIIYDRLSGDGNGDMAVLAWPSTFPYNTTGTYILPEEHYRSSVDAGTPETYQLLNVEFTIPGGSSLISSLFLSASVHQRRAATSHIKVYVDGVEKFTDSFSVTSEPELKEYTLTELGTGAVIRVEFLVAVLAGGAGGTDLFKFNVDVT